jgi:hypothetical protein
MYDASDIEIKIAWWNNRLRKRTKGNLSYNLFTHTILNNCFPGYSILFAVKCNKLYKTNITQGSVTVKYVLIIFRLCRILFTRWRVSTTSKNYIWQH